jgi:hypothetical protein
MKARKMLEVWTVLVSLAASADLAAARSSAVDLYSKVEELARGQDDECPSYSFFSVFSAVFSSPIRCTASYILFSVQQADRVRLEAEAKKEAHSRRPGPAHAR